MAYEIPIWQDWLALHEKEYDRFEYDVRVGESIIPPPDIDANIASMAIDLAKKRIDVVAWKGNSPTIIEIKDFAGLTAIGQLVSYPILFVNEFPDAMPPSILLVAARLLPDVAFILDTYGIPFEVIQPKII
jgi:hypothetical protein